MKPLSRAVFFVVGSAMLLAECATATSSQAATTADPSKAQITVLYDAFGKVSTMQKDWGYAVFIDYGGNRVLFDTGNNPDHRGTERKGQGH